MVGIELPPETFDREAWKRFHGRGERKPIGGSCQRLGFAADVGSVARTPRLGPWNYR
jgi:hypothetical protein